MTTTARRRSTGNFPEHFSPLSTWDSTARCRQRSTRWARRHFVVICSHFRRDRSLSSRSLTKKKRERGVWSCLKLFIQKKLFNDSPLTSSPTMHWTSAERCHSDWLLKLPFLVLLLSFLICCLLTAEIYIIAENEAEEKNRQNHETREKCRKVGNISARIFQHHAQRAQQSVSLILASGSREVNRQQWRAAWAWAGSRAEKENQWKFLRKL